MKIFDGTLATLEHALDARLLRHNVLAGNLANANTPGFVPREIDFAAAMQESQRRGDRSGEPAAAPAPPVLTKSLTLASAGHLVEGAGIPPRGTAASSAGDIPLSAAGPALGSIGSPVVSTNGGDAGIDGNAVDVDRALSAVAENAIQYNAAARAAGKKLAILRYVASDGAA